MTQNCPKCGTDDDYKVYADSDVSEYAYQGETFNGIGVWCTDCNDWIVPVIPQTDLEDIIAELFHTGKLGALLESVK